LIVLRRFYGRVCDEGFTGGNVTVPKRLRNLFDVEDGDYVLLALVEVLKKGDDGGWVRRRVDEGQ